MKTALRMLAVPFRALGRLVRMVRSNDVEDVYGVNPNHISDQQRLTSQGVASNAVNWGGPGSG
jgi:hypothetical protein